MSIPVDSNVQNGPLIPSLEQQITQMEKDGVTLELIIAMVMSNPYGNGAMDNVSNSMSGIAQQSDILSKVQSDVITLNAILSKIESELGTSANPTMSKFPKSLLVQLQNTYKSLFGKGGDLDQLATFEKQFPTVEPIVKELQTYEGDFTTPTNVPAFGTNPVNPSRTMNFAQDLLNWNGSVNNPNNSFILDVRGLAADHYAANHPTKGGGKAGTVDILQGWWTDGNSGQQLASGVSQQNTTELQSYMQLLQGFDSSAQQDIQLASTQKSQMINNETK